VNNKRSFKKKTLSKIKQIFYFKQTNKQTQTPVTNVTKPISVCCKNLNGSVAEFCLLSTADHHTVCWKWEEKKISFFSEVHSESASKTFWSCLI